MKTNQRFNKFERLSLQLRKKSRASANRAKEARRHAYKMAKEYILMVDEDLEGLKKILSSSKFGSGADAVDKWLASRFSDLSLIGEDYWDLIKSIHDGVTEKQYVDSTMGLLKSSKVKKALSKSSETNFPARPNENIPLDEQIRTLRLQNETLRTELNKITRERNQLLNVVKQLEKDVLRLNKHIPANGLTNSLVG